MGSGFFHYMTSMVDSTLTPLSLERASFCQKGFAEEELIPVVTELQTVSVSTTESAILYFSSLTSDIFTSSEVPPLHLMENCLTCCAGLGLFSIIPCPS